MALLYWLESIRFPALDGLMSGVTLLGDSVVLFVLAVSVYWCLSKRQGCYMLLACLFGTAFSQALKLLCRIPRPWVLDPAFSIVEAARSGAGGYSFPSGHASASVAMLGALFAVRKERWLRAVCAGLAVLVCFSRMYLGVHTPLDVGAGIVLALFFVVLLYPFFRSDDAFRRSGPGLVAAGILSVVCLVLFVCLFPFSGDLDAGNYASGFKNSFTLLGCVLGFLVASLADRKLCFQTDAPLAGQLLKLVCGFALLLGIKEGLKALFACLGMGLAAATTLRYFCILVFAGLIWPLSFPFFQKIGSEKKAGTGGSL